MSMTDSKKEIKGKSLIVAIKYTGVDIHDYGVELAAKHACHRFLHLIPLYSILSR